MRRIRVMHILSDLGVGGAQHVVSAVVRGLDRRRFEPSVCCLREEGPVVGRIAEQHIPVHLVRFGSRLSPWGLLRLRALLRREEIDVVHTHLRRANMVGRLAAVLAGTPVVIGHAHDTLVDTKRHHMFLHRLLAERTDRFLCISDAVAEAQAEKTGLPDAFFTTFYNFVDPDRVETDLRSDLARAELNIPVAGRLVGIVGRLHPLKRHDIFLRAAARLARTDRDMHFVVVGDGAERGALRELVGELGLTGRVVFTGSQTDMARVYASLDLLALTSDTEGLGQVVLEALAAGVPVVARAVGGVPEILHFGGGVLVSDDRPERFAEAVRAAFEPETYHALREQTHRNAARFSMARQLTVLEDIYSDLCEAKLDL